MSNAILPTVGPSPDDFHVEFVEGAIHSLAAAVASREAPARATPGRAHGSLARALAVLLRHFGCVVDEVELAVATREGDVETAIRAIAEQNALHVREIELRPREDRRFATPVLAFRGGEAVALLPRTWRRWLEVGVPSSAELEPRAFTFYATLPHEPVRVRDLLRSVLGKESRRDLVFAALWGVVAASLSAASMYLMRSLVEWALPQGDRSGLLLLAAGWCVVAFTASSLRLSRALLQARIGTRAEVGMEAALVSRALSLPVSEFQGIGAGDFSERIRAASQFGKVAYGGGADVAIAAVSVLAYGVMLATTSGWAAVTVGVLLIARVAVAAVLLAGTYADGRRQAIARGKMSGRLFELLSSIPRIRVASAEPRAFYHWATAFAKVRQAGYRASLASGLLSATEGFFDVAGTIVLYAVCCGSGSSAGVGAFVVAASCLGGLQASFSEVVRGAALLLPMIPKVERVRPLLRARAEARTGASATSIEGNVSLRHVTFHYADDDVRILDNVSVDIKAGQFVAIVGPSGCGKSTLIKMILGFYTPSTGSVLLDDKDLRTLDLRSVRRQVGAVLQGSELLPSSILFNIVGTSKKTIDDAWVAAKRASIADDIERMPMKMFTTLSDRAVTISGGQKQRILIARALVREPKLFVFDEATSALDNKTQAGVMDALRAMNGTKICIAHRLSTVVHADVILVMNKGTIVQQGTFAQLMREDGIFRTLAQTQLASEKDVDVDVEVEDDDVTIVQSRPVFE